MPSTTVSVPKCKEPIKATTYVCPEMHAVLHQVRHHDVERKEPSPVREAMWFG